MKTIGVLGGLGPQATMDFEERLHAVSQRCIPQLENSGYPAMIVHYCRHAPILLKEDRTPVLPIQLDSRLLEAAKQLGELCDFLVIACNTPHLLQGEIENASGRKVLSMIGLVVDEIMRRKWRSVGILGYGVPLVYTQALELRQIPFQTIEGEIRTRLDQAVMHVMEGRNDSGSTHAALSAIRELRAKNVDGIVLGCTEIPLMIPEILDEVDILNPIELLAEAAVRFAIT